MQYAGRSRASPPRAGECVCIRFAWHRVRQTTPTVGQGEDHARDSEGRRRARRGLPEDGVERDHRPCRREPHHARARRAGGRRSRLCAEPLRARPPQRAHGRHRGRPARPRHRVLRGARAPPGGGGARGRLQHPDGGDGLPARPRARPHVPGARAPGRRPDPEPRAAVAERHRPRRVAAARRGDRRGRAGDRRPGARRQRPGGVRHDPPPPRHGRPAHRGARHGHARGVRGGRPPPHG